jgi:hypothetical protein
LITVGPVNVEFEGVVKSTWNLKRLRLLVLLPAAKVRDEILAKLAGGIFPGSASKHSQSRRVSKGAGRWGTKRVGGWFEAAGWQQIPRR